MDKCERYNNNRRHRGNNPSFSSSLLDEIYRSIDGGDQNENEQLEQDDHMFMYRKKRTGTSINNKIDQEKKKFINLSSSSASSESSSGGGFSSAEEYGVYRPKPIRTSVPVHKENKFDQHYAPKEMKKQPPKHENGFGKTKSRAMKIYGDLKKVKQPISPGGRLATFLNSLFTTSTPKKAKISSSNRASFDETISRNNNPNSKSSCTSTCSSASSFSRSCLSNPSSREKLSNGGAKRSVRFYPVSVILGEENKNELRSSINEELKLHIMEKNRHMEEVARDLLKNYQKAEYDYFSTRDARVKNSKYDDHNDDDDDVASCASSDLFELDHLSAIEELPVYETTHLRTNLAIANGLIS